MFLQAGAIANSEAALETNLIRMRSRSRHSRPSSRHCYPPTGKTVSYFSEHNCNLVNLLDVFSILQILGLFWETCEGVNQEGASI